MKVAVAVKVVPDTAATIQVVDGRVTWGDAPLVINPWDEYAVEAALQVVGRTGQAVVLSMGDESALEAIRRALAMGAKQAYRIDDPALAEADVHVTARVLAAAVQKVGDVKMFLFGRQAIDGDTGLTPMLVAQTLGWPFVGQVTAFREIGEDAAVVERNLGEARQVVKVPLPAVMTIAKEFGEPRYPSFMGIRKAARAKVPVWSLADLGIDVPQPKVRWPELRMPPKRETKVEFITGDTPREIAEKLIDKLLEEKVL